jgi:hypothetical protein
MKQCTGCGRYDNEPIGLNKNGNPYLACCPDNNYVEVKDLNYWKNNAEEDYLTTPISVLKYISELEKSTPIELPSEHEIEESSFKMSGNNVSPSSNFMIGAYWMKEQILNQNK